MNDEDVTDVIDSCQIDRCIQEGILVEFFRKRRKEVMKAMELEFTGRLF